jgi:hypothetical protein
MAYMTGKHGNYEIDKDQCDKPDNFFKKYIENMRRNKTLITKSMIEVLIQIQFIIFI